MDIIGFGPGQERDLLALSFEPDGDGYLYYRNRWARGVPVTAAERALYLSISAMGSRAPFNDAIRGRPAVAPRRKFGPVYWKILSRVPVLTGVMAILFGFGFGWSWFSAGPVSTRLFIAAIGIGFLLFGIQLLVARLMVRSRNYN